MKIYKINAIILGLIFLCSAAFVKAQTPHKINFKTDFDFHIANHDFKAGDYVIERTGSFSDVYRIRSIDGQAQTFLSFTPQYVNAKPGAAEFVLSFKRYGDEYFLSAIYNNPTAFRVNFRRTKNEIELARKYAGNKKVEVAVNAKSNN